MKKKKKKQNRGNVKGQLVNRAHSGGLSVGEYWVRLFIENEWLFSNGGILVMDDDDLTAAAFVAFPDRQRSKIFHNVVRIRNRYNRGAIACQKSKRPKIRSYRYHNNAAGIAMRISARGKILPAKQQIAQEVSEKHRIKRKGEFNLQCKNSDANSLNVY